MSIDSISIDENEFPIDGTANEIVDFLKSYNFIRINKKMKLWKDVIAAFMDNSGKLFILDNLNHKYNSDYTFSLKIINTENKKYHNKIFLYNLSKTSKKIFRICQIVNEYGGPEEEVDEKTFLNELNKILQ